MQTVLQVLVGVIINELLSLFIKGRKDSLQCCAAS